MENKAGRELPPGIVKFTITREKLRNILSERYNEDVESFSVEEEGISIRLRVPEEEPATEAEEEPGEEKASREEESEEEELPFQ
ncbi:hypothetical protein AKJ65_05065 [candidate division MSBL1 archaeon SCGC-AAA259E19]|uniref:Uncharacterized protein n=1 Tax=candidate division MSBL1 archaeon SCGC-AAA259E19 TaxID=1698264 RepID=A0A133UJ13_9EURY|nr:hypothetical protein AKJ65_05065 [candidate division MSBL1 archaeon SCGC-AAA259E19]